MPVGQREFRRGVGLGVYADPAKERALQIQERRAQVAEQGAEIQRQRESRMADLAQKQFELEQLKFDDQALSHENAVNAEKLILEDSIAAKKALAAVKADTPDFQRVVAENEVKFPRARSSADYQKQIEHNTAIYNNWVAGTQAAEKLQEQRRYDEAQKSAEKLALQEARKQSISMLRADPNLKVAGAAIGEKGEPTVTFKAVDDAPKSSPTITGINNRMKAEFGVELSQVNDPKANMRQVDPTKPKNQWGTTGGSHYAFDVNESGKPRTVLIPTDRFKAYADEYSQAKAGPSAAVPPPAAAATAAAPIRMKLDADGNLIPVQ